MAFSIASVLSGQSSWPNYPSNTTISVTSAGNVGIGTMNPTPANGSTIAPLLVTSGSGVANGIQAVRTNSPGVGGAQVIVSSTHGGPTLTYTQPSKVATVLRPCRLTEPTGASSSRPPAFRHLGRWRERCRRADAHHIRRLCRHRHHRSLHQRPGPYRLQAFRRRRATLRSTNPIESTFDKVEVVCRNVKRWQGGDQSSLGGQRPSLGGIPLEPCSRPS